MNQYTKILDICKNRYKINLQNNYEGGFMLINNGRMFGVLNETTLKLKIRKNDDYRLEFPDVIIDGKTEGRKYFYALPIDSTIEDTVLFNALSRAYAETLCKENGKYYIILSADNSPSLYKIDEVLYLRFEEELDKFFKWKTTYSYDETLFVKFLKNSHSKNCIEFVCGISVEDDKYKGVYWFNF